MANPYDNGDVLRVQGAYTNAAGVPVDPATTHVSVKNPAGLITTYTYGSDAQLVRSATGVFYVDVPFDLSGYWTVRHFSSGAGQAAAERAYYVKQSAF